MMRSLLCRLVGGRSEGSSHALILPAFLWIAFFLVIPCAMLLVLSATSQGPYGTILWRLTGSNFSRALSPMYGPVLLRSLGYSLTTTLLCLILGFPAAYYLGFHAGEKRNALLIFLMIPFWTSCLVAIYSWIIILGRDGLINAWLMRLDITHAPIVFLNTPFSVILGLVYFYFPFMTLPLYSCLEKIPRQYLEASQDLGAGAARTFLKVTLPLALPGVFAGCILTFIPCLGDFLTAEFLGGAKTYLFGNLIENQFLTAQDWPFGAALTVLLLFVMILGLALHRGLEQRTTA